MVERTGGQAGVCIVYMHASAGAAAAQVQLVVRALGSCVALGLQEPAAATVGHGVVSQPLNAELPYIPDARVQSTYYRQVSFCPTTSSYLCSLITFVGSVILSFVPSLAVALPA